MLLLGVLSGITAGAIWPQPAAAEEIQWLAPVDAAVIDPFRPPDGPYGAGNRGLEYGLTDSTPVRAVDDGQVTFAGRIGSDLYITIDHGGGLRSTLAFVTEISVVKGQHVKVGDVVGAASKGFHLTARLDGEYVDPALFVAGVDLVVALVDGPAAPAGAQAPQRAVGQPAIGRGWIDSPVAVVDSAIALSPVGLLTDAAAAVQVWHHQDCTEVSTGAQGVSGRGADGTVTPLIGPGVQPNQRTLIQVAGLGSSSDGASIGKLDAIGLGYAPDNVVGFSYEGGCAPTPFGVDEALLGPDSLSGQLDPTPYQDTATFNDINLSALRLANLVGRAAAARPGVSIDLVAHSLGGVVTRRALEILADRGETGVLGTVLTVASPHQGADLATSASAAAPGLVELNPLLPHGGEERSASSVIQLSEVGREGIDPPGPPPEGVNVIAVAGATDPVVTALNAVWDGATNVVVDSGNPISAHSEITGLPEVQAAFALGQSGLAPACVSLASTIAGTGAGLAIRAAEDVFTVAAGISAWL